MFWPAILSVMSSEPESPLPGSGKFFLFGHLLCGGILLLGWLEGYPVWLAMSRSLGPAAAWVPSAAALLCGLGSVVLVMVRCPHPGRWLRWGLLVVALGLMGLGLSLTDPATPAKHIHVAQYFLLGLAARLVLCRPLPRGLQSTGAWVAVVLYAFHDELLQGLHPQRTFGLDELGSDALAGLAAILVVEALSPTSHLPSWAALKPLVPLVWVLVGAVLLILPLPAFQDRLPPFWLLLPLVAGGAVWFSSPSSFSPPVRHWADQIAVLALLLTPYPVLPHGTPLVFH